jgi:hypothetical protein
MTKNIIKTSILVYFHINIGLNSLYAQPTGQYKAVFQKLEKALLTDRPIFKDAVIDVERVYSDNLSTDSEFNANLNLLLTLNNKNRNENRKIFNSIRCAPYVGQKD